MCNSCGFTDLLGSLFGYLIQIFYFIFKNFGVAIIFFTIVTRLLMFPLTIKQQKDMAAQQRLQPKMNELRNKYGNNKEAYNMAVQELYTKEGVSMSGGCLPMLIQFPLLFGMYAAVRQPLTNVLHVSKEMVAKLCTIFGVSTDTTAAAAGSQNSYYYEVNLIGKIRDYAESGAFSSVTGQAAEANTQLLGNVTGLVDNAVNNAIAEQAVAAMGDKAESIIEMSQSFGFLGLDLLQQASLKPANTALILAFIVVIAQIGSMLITNKMNKVQSTQGCSPNAMGIVFGGMSFWFALQTPAAFPFYWTISSLLSPVQSWVTKEYFGPVKMNAKAEAQRNARLRIDEGEKVKMINDKKGVLKLRPHMPAVKEKVSNNTELNTGKKNKGNNKKNNKGGNPGGYVGKKK